MAIQKLAHLIEIQSGFAFKSKEYTEDGHFLVRISNVQDGSLTLDNPKYVQLDDKTRRFSLNSGDLLTSLTGNIGRVARVESRHLPAALNQRVARLTIKDKDQLSAPYLYHFLSSDGFKNGLAAISRGVAQQNVSPKEISNLEIPLPRLSEQKRIVALLDQAFADIAKARALTEQNLKNARELFESTLQQVFSQRGEGWIDTLLGRICSFKHGFAFKSEYFSDDAALVLLTPGNFYESGGYRDRGDKQKFYDGPYPEEFLLSKGDLLVAMTEQAEGLLGSPALVPEDGMFLHNQRLGLVQLSDEFKDSVELKLLYHLFNTASFRSSVQKTASGVKVRHTSPKKMQEVAVSIPSSLDEQARIAQFLFDLKDECDHLERIYLAKLKQLDELKKSLLQKAFSGELTKAPAEAAA